MLGVTVKNDDSFSSEETWKERRDFGSFPLFMKWWLREFGFNNEEGRKPWRDRSKRLTQ